MVLTNLKQHFINFLGWRTNRKIVVFESDDWGMVRMASKDAWERLLKKGYPVDKNAYSTFDALESSSDVEGLMNTLVKYKDKNGNPAKFTLNNVVANPDFEKIRKSGFESYHYELFTDTLKKYSLSGEVMNLYKEGLSNNIFKPQLHGREHLNVNRWLLALQDGNRPLLDAFIENMYTIESQRGMNSRLRNLDAFGEAYRVQIINPQDSLRIGAKLFEEIWGYKSRSFIAPAFIWPVSLEKVLEEAGVKYIQGTHVQRIPKVGLQFKIERKYHYQGQRNKYHQRYLVRNAFFEPAQRPAVDSVNSTLKQVSLAFSHSKPAIISSHRINYIGRLRPENRSKNLNMLNSLLKQILTKYPEVEFMSSDELGNLMESKNSGKKF